MNFTRFAALQRQREDTCYLLACEALSLCRKYKAAHLDQPFTGCPLPMKMLSVWLDISGALEDAMKVGHRYTTWTWLDIDGTTLAHETAMRLLREGYGL